MAQIKLSSIETTLFHGAIQRVVYDMEEKGFEVTYSHDGGKIFRRHSITAKGSDRDIAKLMLIMTRMGLTRMSGDQLDEATRQLSTEDLIEVYERKA